MKIQLNKGDSKAATQNWNTLANVKNKNKNYCVPVSIEEYLKLDKYTDRLKVGSKKWFFLENAIAAFNEVANRIYKVPEVRSTVSYKTVCEILKEELSIEISARERDPNNKREFEAVLESIQRSIADNISYFDFFFAVEGLELENLEKISCGKVEIVVFDQELLDRLVAVYTEKVDLNNPELLVRIQNIQDFLNRNFLHRICIKSTTYGDFDIANRKAYIQARELINYFRYILCLFVYDRVSEQMVKINLASEVYSNSERILIRRDKDDDM